MIRKLTIGLALNRMEMPVFAVGAENRVLRQRSLVLKTTISNVFSKAKYDKW